jgi:hypothetical protein
VGAPHDPGDEDPTTEHPCAPELPDDPDFPSDEEVEDEGEDEPESLEDTKETIRRPRTTLPWPPPGPPPGPGGIVSGEIDIGPCHDPVLDDPALNKNTPTISAEVELRQRPKNPAYRGFMRALSLR